MAVMLGNLYTALISGGIEPDKAQRAAEEAAAQSDVVKLQDTIEKLRDKLDKLVSNVAVLTWMMGVLLASVIGGFTLVLRTLTR